MFSDNHSTDKTRFLVAVYFFVVVVVLVTSQVLHLEGFNPPSATFRDLQGVRSFMQVTDPRNQFTVCALNAPNQTITAVECQGACLVSCLKRASCVAYNFNSDTTQCDLFDIVPTNYEYDKICVNFRVSN